ncbi:MAG: cupin domain-containing protein [Phaeodactylibacter sp.]|nr:cupin domain-containing protein [Phaeodactylibacter sp.]
MSKFIMTLAPKSAWAKSPRHFHPFQTETFQVIAGELHLKVGNTHLVLTSDDDKVVVEPFVLHAFWNELEAETTFIAEIYPPVDIEKGIRMTYQLSKAGKINKRNIPYNPFYSLLLMHYFDSYFRFIPWKLQQFLFRQGASLARFFGYK